LFLLDPLDLVRDRAFGWRCPRGQGVRWGTRCHRGDQGIRVNRSQTYKFPTISLKMADHVIMANVNSQTRVLSLSSRTQSWGGPRRDGSFLFSFILSSRFSCFL